jgi:cyclophilin family peptidyl-prolyl cis-trans isomerase
MRYGQAQREAYLERGGTPFLDREYTVFGQVIEGMDVIDRIASVRTRPGDRPEEDVWMKIRVIK